METLFSHIFSAINLCKQWRTTLEYGVSTICHREIQIISQKDNSTTGIKHRFSCNNIRQVPWEVLKTEAGGRGFQHLPRDLANVNALKNHFRSLLLHKNWKHLLHFAVFLALFVSPFYRCLTNAISTDMLVLGPGSTHLVTAANLWPRYDHFESWVAVH